ncbi:LON peptidase substrate-binding domain-containing protein [Cyclobacterium jeungdonense]|uniref:LON peptidase substrate-binding domain-containing protein n=1 Tax=Cyclobacterium jeungdonense TaxID=708087 RepID=A0ABT8C6C3_9BACT|nr:LON peptidase substrate-binding domain-containing protein [Cyclobacterium jeungdonense]MDN3687569.1 LON peptidase substrate-binding domain-containing protein [Cyclobacterium jeungdonense]
MTQELAFFPLKLVAFPQEDLNLHIFEPRYKELIQDCIQSGQSFGICTYLDKLMPVGTEVSLVEISNEYDDGRMDIKTKGVKTFKILDFQNPLKDKLYAGGKVAFLPLDWQAPVEKLKAFETLLETFFDWMHHAVDLKSTPINSFTYAHKIALKPSQEYQLLELSTEEERLDFLLDHLQNLIPVLKEIEASKNKIKMNGHFKYLDPLNF